MGPMTHNGCLTTTLNIVNLSRFDISQYLNIGKLLKNVITAIITIFKFMHYDKLFR